MVAGPRQGCAGTGRDAGHGEIIGTVRRIRASSGSELIVIDTMPSVAADIASIARAADYVLIPYRPSILDLQGDRRRHSRGRAERGDNGGHRVEDAAPAPRGAGGGVCDA